MSNKQGLDLAAKKIRSVLASYVQAYAAFYFSNRYLSGILFIAATFVVPAHGAAGLLGMVACEIWARCLSLPIHHIREGFFGFNGLLVGLALGLFFRFDATFVAVLVLSTLLTVVLAAALRTLFERFWGLPVLSLPFVIVTWMVMLASRRFSALEIAIDPVLITSWGAGVLPKYVELYLRTLAVAFFQLNLISGILIFIGILWFSRWSAILSIIGFASGFWVYTALGGSPYDMIYEFVGFNFVFTAIAVGGVWIVLSPASIVLAVVSCALAAMVAAGWAVAVKPFELPGFAIPFIVTTQLILYAVSVRSGSGRLRTYFGFLDSPENNLATTLSFQRRYPDPSVPSMYLPVMGQWVITQGPNGIHTHQGQWAHAWDFEVCDDDGVRYRDEGKECSDFFAFGVPVMAPRDGKVVRVVNHLMDNPIGDVQTSTNWGNVVVIWHYGDVYSALCHLQQSSIAVYEGQYVYAGQMVGRVGNSGRSPVPHLHFQIQSSSDIGSPTKYCEFLHYIQTQNGAREYVTHGVPKTDQRISSMDIDDSTRRALVLTPGRKWRWTVRRGNHVSKEEWNCQIDFYGNRKITESKFDTSLRFYCDYCYTTLLDYTGTSEQLLGLLYLGVARVPYVQEEDLVWRDSPNSNRFIPSSLRILQELASPFREIAGLSTESRMIYQRGLVRVTTQLRWGWLGRTSKKLPTRIELEFKIGVGPTGIRAYRKQHLLVEAELEE